MATPNQLAASHMYRAAADLIREADSLIWKDDRDGVGPEDGYDKLMEIGRSTAIGGHYRYSMCEAANARATWVLRLEELPYE